MSLNETYSRVRVGKHLSDMFHIKDGLKKIICFIAIPFQVCFRIRHRRVQLNQDDLKLNGRHQLFCADNVNTLGGSILTYCTEQSPS
jgi:hypothetical protein